MVTRQIPLRFTEHAVEAETHINLSAIRAHGDSLWLAGDETATVERMHAASGDEPGYGNHRSFALSELVDLPGNDEQEADIEGLGISRGWLWAIGSHSLLRKKVKSKHSDVKAIRRLAKVRDEANRHIIARLAIEDGPDGVPHLVRETSDGRRSAVLGADPKDSLTAHLAGDEHLADFLRIPAKDNGLDVEGIAVRDNSLYVGLRGPVLRGWAVVLELLAVGDADSKHMKLGEFDDRAYRKHFLDLRGLGVRDLCPQGDDLLVLAGPSMDLDGPVRVYRWHGAANTDTPDVVRAEELTTELDLPYGEGDDHAEGLSLLPDGEHLLVVYDSPSQDRCPTGSTILADIVPLP